MMVSYVLAMINRKLGRCPRCWRLSFTGAVLGSVLVVALRIVGTPPQVLIPLLAWPVAFTVLWLAHLVTFAGRNLRSARAHDGIAAIPLLGKDVRVLTRRDSMRLLGRSVKLAALVSAAPLVSAVLSACGKSGGTSGPRFSCPSGTLTCHTVAAAYISTDGIVCCVNGESPRSATGYGCILRSTGQLAGCTSFATMQQIRNSGQCTGEGIIQCVA